MSATITYVARPGDASDLWVAKDEDGNVLGSGASTEEHFVSGAWAQEMAAQFGDGWSVEVIGSPE